MALGTADLLNRFFFLRYKKATGGTLMFIENFLPSMPGFKSRRFWFHFLRSVFKRNPYLMVTS